MRTLLMAPHSSGGLAKRGKLGYEFLDVRPIALGYAINTTVTIERNSAYYLPLLASSL